MCPEEKGHLLIQERGHYNHSATFYLVLQFLLPCSLFCQFGVDSFFNKHFRSKLLRHAYFETKLSENSVSYFFHQKYFL